MTTERLAETFLKLITSNLSGAGEHLTIGPGDWLPRDRWRKLLELHAKCELKPAHV